MNRRRDQGARYENEDIRPITDAGTYRIPKYPQKNHVSHKMHDASVKKYMAEESR